MDDHQWIEALVQDEELLESTLLDVPESLIPDLCAIMALELIRRYDRTGRIDENDRAIRMGEKAVELSPEDDPYRAIHLSNLGVALLNRFERTGSMDDLDRAIVTNEQAIELTSDHHPNC